MLPRPDRCHRPSRSPDPDPEAGGRTWKTLSGAATEAAMCALQWCNLPVPRFPHGAGHAGACHHLLRGFGVHSWALPLAPGKNGPGREPAAPRAGHRPAACGDRPAGGSGGALSPGPGTSHPREVTTMDEDSFVDGFTRARTQRVHLAGPCPAPATSQHRHQPWPRGGNPGAGEPILPPLSPGLWMKRRGRRQVRSGQAVAWRRGRTGAWPRRGLLQWHQVSPGAASAQAHLQGHLWVASRDQCRSGQLAITSQSPTGGRPQCKADTP